ncbi:MAG TPA: GGDEF domain-containing protein [Caulobacteraceae bacterium]|nr:GGDEF domain-containing protein [Caulobacteraceae bacterium]
MPGALDGALRGPQGYAVARAAIEMMEEAAVWPTALNFELWLNMIADPKGALAREIQRLLGNGEAITDAVAEDLAHTFLPKARLTEQIYDTGDALSQELASVSKAIQEAQASSAVYGRQLQGASRNLDTGVDETGLKSLVAGLTHATTRVQTENGRLEQRLAESTAEVDRLRAHLIQVRRDATTDALTNLANRKAFDEELERACAEGAPLQLAVLDIDHFKMFNDTWGHQTGDQVLRYVASVIGRVGAPPRFAARYGGEEFAMIFTREAARQVEKTLEVIRGEVASRLLKRRSTNEDLGAITLSAGFAQRRPQESPAALMERADAALYASKREGRNRVTSAERRAAAA